MVINWDQTTSADAEEPVSLVRAAEYVRMSTEHQRYSADNQSVAIHQYAEARGYAIVKRYADKGKSGLNIEGRKGLKQLLSDIESGNADFDALIVYDVSRWGRFQDVDEAASYELQCRRAGVAVHYCAEQFENDGSIGSSIIKTVKRAMAGEYSRELSVKVFAGQSHLIRLGYRQGGAAGYGLRRMLVDQHGTPKNELARGEHKSIATDRVILVPGPRSEIEIVQDIYSRFVAGGCSEFEISEYLNSKGVLTDLGRRWTRGTVHQILINEKYIGNNVWGRTSCKLKGQHIRNDESDWIRSDNVFEAIIDEQLFSDAQRIIAKRSNTLSDDEMLERLRRVFQLRGTLSGLIIDEVDICPSSSTYSHRFGGLLRAYALVGFTPPQDYGYLETNQKLRALFPAQIDEVISNLEQLGNHVVRNPDTDLLHINSEYTVSLVAMRSFKTEAGSSRWKLRLDTSLSPDITIAIRMNETNDAAKDYYVLPMLDMSEALLRLAEYNGLSFDAYRFDNLAGFYRLTCRTRLAAA